jgi:TIR domain
VFCAGGERSRGRLSGRTTSTAVGAISCSFVSEPNVLTGHAFISYVRGDSSRVDQLHRALEDAGIPVWLDTTSLWPGEDWRAKIRRAITDDALAFVVCFSRHSLGRDKSYQNEELVLAIDQLRLRRPDVPWLIPVRFDECAIPDTDLAAAAPWHPSRPRIYSATVSPKPLPGLSPPSGRSWRAPPAPWPLTRAGQRPFVGLRWK